MANTARSQEDTLRHIALNILTGQVDPEKWRGLRKVDDEDAAVLDIFREVRDWGHGRIEVTVIAHKLDTAYKTLAYKKKDLIKE
jgi:hypothetical protein